MFKKYLQLINQVNLLDFIDLIILDVRSSKYCCELSGNSSDILLSLYLTNILSSYFYHTNLYFVLFLSNI